MAAPRAALPWIRAAFRTRELEAVSRRYMQEMIPFVGPHTDVMAPDMGTNEQVMAWFMDTYSMYQGYTVTEIVTGKPVELGGTVGRREATGRGVAYPGRPRARTARHAARGTHRHRARLRQCRRVAARQPRLRCGVKIVGLSDAHRRLLRSQGARSSRRSSDMPRATACSRAFPSRSHYRSRRTAGPALRHPGARRHRARHHREERRHSSNAASWPKAPTARPRPTPTASSTSAGTRSSSSPTSSAMPAA